MTAMNMLPTVLVIDDDPACTDYLSKQFLDDTKVGVIRANNLTDAKRIVQSADMKFDCVMTDLFFGPGTDDPENHLYDGIDFLAWLTKNSKRNLPLYVNSFYAEGDRYQRQAERLGVKVEKWFQKSFRSQADQDTSAWKTIEQDLFDRLAGAAVPNSKRTYIDEIDSDEIHVRPGQQIEILIVQEEECSFAASCPLLGLSSTGTGETVSDAIDQLKEHIQSAFEFFETQPATSLVGFASFSKEQLNKYLVRNAGGANA